MLAKSITFVGFGLLASSMAAALRESKVPVKIRAVSSRRTLDRAGELNFADEFFGYDEVEAWARETDLILLCSPILHILEMLEKLATVRLEKPVLVSDIGSTKAAICLAGAKLPKPFLFVGGHPMAGSEKRTLEYNDPSLFENAYWLLCPPEDTPPGAYRALSELISFLGAQEVHFEPAVHDRVIAWLSHMPQMVSSTLAGNLPRDLLARNYQHFAGRGFRDMTRIAASGWNMWRDILKTNRTEILRAFDDFLHGAKLTREAIEGLESEGDAPLHEIFEAGNAGRASLFAQEGRSGHAFFELTVALEDRPGTILDVMRPIAEAGLNIRDIELMKVRENVSGTLLLAFKQQEDAARAVEILTEKGFSAALR